MKTILLLVLLCCTLLFDTNAQSLSFKPIYHFGTYSGGDSEPGLDWELWLDVPLTPKLEVNASIYYYSWLFADHYPRWEFSENYWLIGIGFTYTFSEEPLLE